jgi:hypothetical protein
VREAIREKLRRETKLYPKEVERILEVWEKQRKGENDWLDEEEVWNNLEK